LELTTDRHKASRGLFATELLVISANRQFGLAALFCDTEITTKITNKCD